MSACTLVSKGFWSQTIHTFANYLQALSVFINGASITSRHVSVECSSTEYWMLVLRVTGSIRSRHSQLMNPERMSVLM